MSLRYLYRKASALIDRMNPAERMRLDDLCRQIRDAEAALNCAASELLQNCGDVCRGLCCRNLQTDAVIEVGDLVYILAEAGALRDTVSRCLEHEDAFYTSNCPFLEGGAGPCVFPEHLRPEVCITTFCQDDAPVRAEIRQVRKCFRRLDRYIFFHSWRKRLSIQ